MKVRRLSGGLVILIALLAAHAQVSAHVINQSRHEQPVVIEEKTFLPSSATSEEEIKRLTYALVVLSQKENSNTRDASAIRDRIKKLAAERHTLLKDLAKHDPDQVVDSLLPAFALKKLAALAPKSIEKKVTLEGTLAVFHVDYLDNRALNNYYYLVKKDHSRVPLYFARGTDKKLLSGKPIRITGYDLDGALVVDMSEKSAIALLGEGESGMSGPATPANGTYRVALLMINFQDTQLPSLDAATVEQTVFSGANNYYIENSYGLVNMTGTVFGWYSLPIDKTCDYEAIADAALLAANNDVYFPDYDIITMVGPYQGCPFGGVGTLGKVDYPSPDGPLFAAFTWIQSYGGNEMRIYSHEFGHNFGVHHAGFLWCPGESINANGCDTVEYGDQFSVMGGGGLATTMHMGAPHKYDLGWFQTQNLVSVTVSGMYTIKTIEPIRPETQVLTIPRAPQDALWVEYRQPYGFDSGTYMPDVYEGALLHTTLADPSATPDGHTWLVDATPANSNNAPTLHVGSSFLDPATGSTLQVTDKTFDQLTVQVTLGKTEFTPPTTTITTPLHNTTVTGTIPVTVDASDTSGIISKVELYSSSRGLVGTDFVAPFEFNLDTTQEVNGPMIIHAIAYDTAGDPFGAPNNAGISNYVYLWVDNVDPVPPSVTITSPADNATVTGLFTLSADASDNVGVFRVEFFRDNESFPFYSDEATPFSTTTVLGDGAHQLSAVAVDFALNRTTSTISVTAITDTTPPTVTVTNPTAGAYVSGIVSLQATVNDNTSVSKVEFYVDGVLRGIDTATPYASSWSTSGLPPLSSHTVTARAYDSFGNIGYSADVVVYIADLVAPTISITAPTANSSVSGVVTITASASDDVAVSKVEFYADGTLISTDTSVPFNVSWDSALVTPGAYTLTAKAYDSSNNNSTSAPIPITVLDVTAPTTVVTAPANGSFVTRNTTVTITASATDNGGINKVELYVSGSLKCTDTAAPYSCNWRVPSAKGVVYTLQSKAYDLAGNNTLSSAVSVTSK